MNAKTYKHAVCLFLAALFLFFSFSHAADTWYNYYKKGLKAIEARDWDKAARYFVKALQEREEPDKDARTVGMDFMAYYPHYHLGLVYYKTGRWQDALSKFEVSLTFKQGIHKDKQLYSRLQSMQEECRVKLAPPAQAKDQPARDTAAVTTTPKDTQQPAESEQVKTSQLIKQYIAVGESFREKKNFSAALEQYKKAQSLIEESKEEIGLLSNVNQKIQLLSNRKKIQDADRLRKTGDFDGAEDILVKILRDNPKNAQAKKLLDRVRNGRKRAGAEQKVLAKDTQVPASSPDAGAVAMLLAEGKQNLTDGNHEEARAKFAAALQIDKRHPEALRYLRNIDYETGVKELNQGIERYFMGQRSRSENLLREAVRLLSRNPATKNALVQARQFLAILLIEGHYLSDDPLGKRLEEARKIIKNIFLKQPDFKLEDKYFSPKVIREFTRTPNREP